MNNLIENKIFVLVAFMALIITFSYVFIILDEPRMSDGVLKFNETNAFEIMMIMLAPIAGISMWFLAIVHSFNSGRNIWGIITIFAWPVAFLYAVMVNFVWSKISENHR